ncbi:hypothetical protein [Sorangium sp. So ce385]|uniref:hypothetical protein n=1 Tax=Sorangium sp. So ce385 TaxID=3133308 RepID=UPI003F5B9102
MNLKSINSVQKLIGVAGLVGFAAALLSLVPACERTPTSSPLASSLRSVRKIEGAPAQVLDVQFAPDGASVLILERRRKGDDGAPGTATFAVSRRPIAGGAARDLIASSDPVLKLAPLGDGIVMIRQPAVPPESVALAAEEVREDRTETRRLALENKHLETWIAANEKAALYRVDDGGAPVRISPEGRRCVNVVGTAGGQRVAFSVAPQGGSSDVHDTGAAEIHVLHHDSGEVVTLEAKGVVRGISADGARLLVQNRITDRYTSEKAKDLVMVTVKGEAVAELPAVLEVDGVTVSTAELSVGFLGDGLVFRSAEGDHYRAALDGSKATRLAAALAGAGSLDAGAPPADSSAAAATSAAMASAATAGSAEAPPPSARSRRLLGSTGAVFELREAGNHVSVSLIGPSGGRPIAQLEGPLAGIGPVALDAAEARVALAVFSDTSRDGDIDATYDDAEIFVSDAGEGSLSFGRAPVTTLADELRPAIAAAAGVPAEGVHVAYARGSLDVTAELPWIERQKAKALVERSFAAARAITGALAQRRAAVHLRVGPLALDLEKHRDEGGRLQLALWSPGLVLLDPQASPLVLRNPVHVRTLMSNTETVSGILENTGKEPTPPIEVVAVMTNDLGSFSTRDEVKKPIGVIAPGRRVPYHVILKKQWFDTRVTTSFRAAGKVVAVFNEYGHAHHLDALDTALDAWAAHGVWADHGRTTRDRSSTLVRLTAGQAALPDGARSELFQKIEKALRRHHDRFHKGLFHVTFEAPDGTQWGLVDGRSASPYEARLVLGDPLVSSGSVSNAGAVVAGMDAPFRRCARRGFTASLSLQGSVTMIADLDQDGEVASVRPYEQLPLSSGLPEPFVTCLAAYIQRARFAPPSDGSATIRIPVTVWAP